MKSGIFNISFKKEIFIISLFPAVYVVYSYLSTFDTSITDFSTLYISQATLEGVEVSARVRLFYQSIFSFFILLAALYFVFFALLKNIASKHLAPAVVLSLTGVFIVFSDIFQIHGKNVIFIFFLLLIIFLLLITFRSSRWRYITEPGFYNPIICISILGFSAIIFLFNSNRFVLDNAALIYIVIVCITMLVVILLKQIAGTAFRKIYIFLLPLSLIPVFIFMAIESLIFIKEQWDVFIPYKWTFLACILISAMTLNIYYYRSPLRISTSKLLSRYFIPAALLSFLLLTLYIPVIAQSQELFELANPANAQMRVFVFNEIPFIDFMTSHMFGEQFYGYIHNFIFGYKADLSFQRYSFLYEIIVYFVAYIFMSKLFKNSMLAVLFIISFPFVHILFSFHLFFGVIVFFAIIKALNTQTIANYSLLMFLLIFMCFWRLDTGISTLFTAVVFLPLMLYTKRKKVLLPALFKALILVLITLIIIISTFVLLRSPDLILENFQNALHYVSGNQAHGYAELTRAFNHQFYLFHFVLPFSAVLAIFLILFRLREKIDGSFSQLCLSSSLFFYLVYIVNFQRGLVRHSFFEGSDTFLTSTFYVATVLFIISFVKKKYPVNRYVAFLASSFLIIVSLKYYELDKGNLQLENYIVKSTLTGVDYNFNDNNFEGKVTGEIQFAEENFLDLKSFLDKNLKDNETFLDFSNTPMLYYYCQREIPSYFCQSLQNTIDDFLQLQHLKRVNTESVPVVVYSNYPLNWFDKTDGVPNAMRQYLIADFIFQNYRPFSVINKHSIWVAKNREFILEEKFIDTLAYELKTHDYKYAASFIARHFASKPNALRFISEVASSPNNIKGINIFTIDENLHDLNNTFLKVFTGNPSENKQIKIEVFGDSDLLATLLFNTSENEQEYMMPLTNHFLMHINEVKTIKLFMPDEVAIKKLELYKDVRQ